MAAAASVNNAAFIKAVATDLVVEQRPVPTPGEGEVLIRNHAIALNPLDWKRQAWGFLIPTYPNILGSDVAGEVVSVGPAVSQFKPGDRVFGFSDAVATNNLDHAAFQDYTVVPQFVVAKLPDAISYEVGSTLVAGPTTASVALFGDLGLPLPEPVPQKKRTGAPAQALLVWGASSAVGSMVVQLAHLSGFTVYATASPAHHAHLETLGASYVFDYHSPTVVADILATAAQSLQTIRTVVDAISEPATLRPAAEVLLKTAVPGQPGGKSRLVLTLPWPEEGSPDKLPRPDPSLVAVTQVQGATVFGSRRDLSAWLFNRFLPRALEAGAVLPSSEVQLVPGGLAGLQEGLNILKAGVSGKKVVVKLV